MKYIFIFIMIIMCLNSRANSFAKEFNDIQISDSINKDDGAVEYKDDLWYLHFYNDLTYFSEEYEKISIRCIIMNDTKIHEFKLKMKEMLHLLINWKELDEEGCKHYLTIDVINGKYTTWGETLGPNKYTCDKLELWLETDNQHNHFIIIRFMRKDRCKFGVMLSEAHVNKLLEILEMDVFKEADSMDKKLDTLYQ